MKTAIAYILAASFAVTALFSISGTASAETAQSEHQPKIALAVSHGGTSFIYRNAASPSLPGNSTNRDALLTVTFIVLIGISIASAFYALLKQA